MAAAVVAGRLRQSAEEKDEAVEGSLHVMALLLLPPEAWSGRPRKGVKRREVDLLRLGWLSQVQVW